MFPCTRVSSLQPNARAKPLCVQWCLNDALTYEEREEEVEEEVKLDDMEVGLESMVDKYGLQKVMDTVARMSKKE
jgi:benzoyl-CoA reductase subunit BamC